MKYAIAIRDENDNLHIVGAYTRQATAQLRIAPLLKRKVKAIVLPMEKDGDFFGKPIGNRTNH